MLPSRPSSREETKGHLHRHKASEQMVALVAASTEELHRMNISC